MVEETKIGTWDYGLTRLLLGLTTTNQSQMHYPLDALPYDQIEFSLSELLGKWIHLINALRDDLALFSDNTQMTMEDWINYLVCLVDSYFSPDFSNEQSVDDFEDLKKQFEVLRNSAKSCRDTLFNFFIG